MTNNPQRPPTRQEPSRTLVSLIQQAIPARGGLSLVIAIAGAASLFLGLILLLFLQELRGAAYTVLAIGGILLIAALMMSFATVMETITGRRGRYSTNTLVMVAAFVALVVLVYVVAARNPQRWDVTATGQFSLAPQTLYILENLAEPVKATAFFVPGDTQQEAYRIPTENLLNEFRHRSSNKFSYDFVDPDRQPTLAKQYRVTQYPTIAFEGEESGLLYRLTAPLFQERDFSSALLIVTGVEQKAIYYLTGHGERNLQDFEVASRQGFGSAASAMSRDNYAVLPLSLAQTPEIPGDAAAIIIAGPTRDLEEEERQILHSYLKSGGRLLLLLEPGPPQTFKDLLARWAVTVDDGTIIDLVSSLAGQPQTPLIKREQYLATPPIGAITSPLDQSYFPGATSFRPSLPPEEMPETIAYYPVAQTTLLSCLTPDPKINTCPQGDFNILFPVWAFQAIAPLNEEPDPDAPREARVVIFGDTDFATNFHLYSQSNSDFLLNTVNWLTEDISLASVRPKAYAFRRLVVTAREMQLLRGLSWFVLPAAMAMLAGVAWWRRR